MEKAVDVLGLSVICLDRVEAASQKKKGRSKNQMKKTLLSILLSLFILSNISCTALATKGNVIQDENGKNIYIPTEYIKLEGYSGRKAEFKSGGSIEKDTGLNVPDFVTN